MKAIYAALLLISAASLAFQVLLTRVFALAQGHHLAFMAVSLALLGAGASGTYLSLRPPSPTGLPRLLTGGALLFTLALPAAYLAINYLPFDAYQLAIDRSQLLWLTLYYLALTLPFFCGGLVIGATLVTRPEQAGSLYAANLLGSALGPPLALLALATVGGPGTVFVCALLGWLAAVSSWMVDSGWRMADGGWRMAGVTHHVSRFPFPVSCFLALAITLLLLYLAWRPPALFEVQLTPYKSLSQVLLYPGSEVILRRWNAFARVDVVRSEGIRSAPGLSFAYPGQLPPQLGLLVDGDNLSPITNPTEPTFTHYLPVALSFELRPAADTLILEPGGGLAVLAALQNGARSVTVVQSNPTIVEAVGRRFADFNGHLYSDPRVTVVVDEPRRFLRRSEQRFDLIILPLTDSFHPVTAGAYTLGEDYRYTVEAFIEALSHLTPDGLLVVERWLQLPPSESLRLWGTMAEALRQHIHQTAFKTIDPASHLLALRSLQTSLIAVSWTPLSAQSLIQVRQFARERQFDLIWLPDIRPEETNRFSIVPGDPYYQTFAGLLAAPKPAAFLAAYPYAVAPPTDNQPFFFHFFKWQQTPEILQALGKTWQPFGGSGYLVLVVLLVLVIVLSAGLILLPLLWPKPKTRNPKLETQNPKPKTLPLRVRSLLYFALLGLGFLCVEIPLLQRFILYLGQPAYAFAVVISALLVAAGVGSGYVSKRLPLRIALLLITVLALIYPWLLPSLFEATLPLPLAGRAALTVVALFPIGLLLGVPFPRGLGLIGRAAPELTPWVWAVNGCASVISAVLAAMIALTWGFSIVLWGAGLAYALAGLVIPQDT